MSEWKTVRVRAGLLADVKARAGAEGSNATAWIERALGAALETPDGGPSPDHGGGSGSKPGRATPAPRRASVGGLTVHHGPSEDAGVVIGKCPRAMCPNAGPVGEACPNDRHLKFKA